MKQFMDAMTNLPVDSPLTLKPQPRQPGTTLTVERTLEWHVTDTCEMWWDFEELEKAWEDMRGLWEPIVNGESGIDRVSRTRLFKPLMQELSNFMDSLEKIIGWWEEEGGEGVPIPQ